MTAEKQSRKEKAAEAAALKPKTETVEQKKKVKDIHCKDCKSRQNAGGHPGRGMCSHLGNYVPRKVVDNKIPCDGEGFKSNK